MKSDHELLRELGFALAGVGLWLTPGGYGIVPTEQALEAIREAAAD
jgi:hypothetical protein